MIRRSFFSAIGSLLAACFLKVPVKTGGYSTKQFHFELTKTKSWEITKGFLIERWEVTTAKRTGIYYVRDLNKGTFYSISFKDAIKLLQVCPAYRLGQAMLQAKSLV